MTPEFNEWWDSDDLLEENPYDIGKPICWAWEGWQAARKREWVGLTDEQIIETSFAHRFVNNGYSIVTKHDLIQFAKEIENKLRENHAG